MRIYGVEQRQENKILKTIKRVAVKNAPLGMISDPIHFANIASTKGTLGCYNFISKLYDTLERVSVMITEPKSSPIATLVNKACRLIGKK